MINHTNKSSKLAVKGVRWGILARAWSIVISFFVSIILARILTPADFGLVITALVLSGLASLIASMGIGSVIILRKQYDQCTLDSAFKITLLSSLFVTLPFLIFPEQIVALYDGNTRQSIVVVLSFTIILSSLRIVPHAVLEGNMKFHLVSITEMLSVVIGAMTGLTMAVMGYGVWSIVGQILTSKIIAVFGLFFYSGYRPGWLLNSKKSLVLLRTGTITMGGSLVNYIGGNSDRFMIGKMEDESALGNYSMAHTLLLIPSLTGVLGRVMFPMITQIKDDPKKIQSIILSLTRALSLFVVPASFGLFIMAEQIVEVAFGQRWSNVPPILRVLCLYGLFSALMAPANGIFMAMNKVPFMFKLIIFRNVLILLSTLLGAQFGFMGIVWGFALSSIIGMIVFMYFAIKLTEGKLITWFAQIMPAVIALLIMVSGILIFREQTALSSVQELVIEIPMGMLLFFAVMYIFYREELFESMKLFIEIIPQKLRPRVLDTVFNKN